MDGLKPYAAYKDSGLPWLGQVPAHWGLAPNRAVLRRRKKLVGDQHPNYRLLSLTKEGVIIRDVASGKGKFSSDPGTCQEVRRGDLVFCLFDVAETPRTVGLSQHDGMITGAYTVFECADSLLTSYLDLYYRTLDDQKSLEPLYVGLRNTIPPTRLLGIKSPIPPREEQAAIVRYLDHATRKIDKAIRAKRKIIALLNEQKQAIIHRAVTHGLDPNVPLKDSGIPWLGQIPAHWEVVRVKYLLREVDQRSETGTETLLSMRMHHGLVPFAEHFSRPPQAATLVGFKLVSPGQFVVNRMQAGNGVIYASSLVGLVSPDYAVLDPIGDINIEFLGELFRSPTVRAKFRAESKGLGTGTSGFLRLYSDRLGAIHVAIPPRQEQDDILVGIETQVRAVSAAIARIENEVGLLREYRTRLIADVVTGKLDVREAATQLPEPEVDEPLETLAVEDDEEALEEAA